jgi:hypothetical protein
MGILNRTIFMDTRKSQIRFYDWVLTTTTLGSMVEPRQLNTARIAGQQIDPTDDLARIDNIASVDMRQHEVFFNGQRLHGGDQYPAIYYYST